MMLDRRSFLKFLSFTPLAPLLPMPKTKAQAANQFGLSDEQRLRLRDVLAPGEPVIPEPQGCHTIDLRECGGIVKPPELPWWIAITTSVAKVEESGNPKAFWSAHQLVMLGQYVCQLPGDIERYRIVARDTGKILYTDSSHPGLWYYETNYCIYIDRADGLTVAERRCAPRLIDKLDKLTIAGCEFVEQMKNVALPRPMFCGAPLLQAK